MKRPSFQFYPQDWLSDPNVIAMTATERGAYIQLLATMWTTEDCQLKDDQDYLSRIAQVDNVVITSLYPCFKVVNGELRHKRLDEERKKQDKYREKCSDAGKKGMKNRWSEPKKHKVVITNDNSSSSSSTSIHTERGSMNGERGTGDGFSAFWEIYPRTVAKRKCEKLWKDLNLDKKRDDIIKIVRVKMKSEMWTKDNGKFIPSSKTWLEEERWNDGEKVKVEFEPQSTEPIREAMKQEAIKKHLEWQKSQETNS